MGLLADLVLQTANAPGTATFNLIAPSAGRRSFISATGAGQTYYYAHDGTNWEIGYGTVTAGSPDTLSRDTVLANSLGTTARINFVVVVNLWNDVPAARSIYAAADNLTIPHGGRILTGLGAATAADHAPRFDQVDTRLGSYSVASGTIVIPTGGSIMPYRISVLGLQPNIAAPLFMRFSVDGGATYQAGASEYGYENLLLAGAATPSGVNGGISYLPLMTQAASASNIANGNIEIWPGQHLWAGYLIGYNGTARTLEFPTGNWVTSGTPTHWLIGGVGATLLAGVARIVVEQF